MTVAPEPEDCEYRPAPGRVLPYRLLRPADPEPGKKYPLVLLLHGAGECGTDNTAQMYWFWDRDEPRVLNRPEFGEARAFAVMPQCPAGQQWVNVPWATGSYASPPVSESLRLTLDLVESLLVELPIDPGRVHIVGMSMGGYGAIDAVQRRPDLFAAAVSVCGAGDPAKARAIAHVPVWAFHGELDDAVPVSGSRELTAALRAAGGSPRYTEYAGVGHNSWSPAFAEPELWTWLFSQSRTR